MALDQLAAAPAEPETVRARQPRSTRRRRLDTGTRVILALVLLVIFLLVVWPLASILSRAFSPAGLVAISSMLEPLNLRVIGNTVLLGVVVGVAGTLVGFLLAYAQARLEFRGKKVLHLLALMPIVSPPFAVATSFITLFGRSGIITNGIFGAQPNVYGLVGLSFVLTFSFFPVAYLNLLGMLRNLDPSLEEASANLGAGRGLTFWRVTLPMLLPGIAGSFLLLFVEAIADLANPLVLGGNFPVLSSRIYIAVSGEYNVPAATAYALVLLLPSALVFLIQRYWSSRKNVTTVSGKFSGRLTFETSPAARVPILAGVAVVVGCVALIYGTMVVGGFVPYLGSNNTFTLANYGYILGGLGSDAILTTTVLAAVATPLAAALGMLVAWLVVRKLERASGFLDFIAMLGVAVPGTVVGLGYAIAFTQPLIIGNLQFFPALAGGAAILGGAVGIVMVYTARSLPSATRSGVAALQQISPAIEEASVSLGANSSVTFRRITLPMIRPAFLTGLVYAFARSMTTLSPIIFITTPQIKIMTSQILGSVEAGHFGIAFAYCTILTIIVLGVIGLLSLLTNGGPGARPARRRP